ncbi:para-nitrobenzyl esterase [Corynebacterium liangguodongii]|uniref:Carboxylic ester hydrolase n=1 Tax=Corynebacterium liangguodongii TaxID=2079535 RepID=A0A2S0WDJ2_9CORY|nr:para-nitrobenzyl esterase [Corynebacterium liangguodongii]PWB98925.1 carboxylesterase/lipase family protein [Corynebacterium liangguodongii]
MVRTSSGQVRGVVDPLTGARTWRGVPFGASTAGPQRFRAPRPAPEWEGVREAVEYAPPAVQTTLSLRETVVGSEDCLTLDVVRPDTDDELPVVVYFHGGTFVTGASHEKVLQGHYLAQSTNVVYVSVNFRLGALGYLDMRSLGDDCVANPALYDQILALRWVHDNIAAFGGNPGAVTLMGESAGGAAVLHLMCAPAARGLFHRAIAQSPPSASVHSRVQAAMWVRKLIDGLSLPRDTTLADLRAVPADDIVRVGRSMMLTGKEVVQFNTAFMPTVDGSSLPRHPIDAFAAGEQASVPLIIGTNSDEASFAKAMYQTTRSRQRAARRALEVFDAENALMVLKAYGYAGGRADFADLIADAVFWAPSVMLATAHRVSAPTWMYRFDYASTAMHLLGLGAMHSADLVAVFGDPYATRVSKLDRFGSREAFEEVSREMQAHWGAFFHTGRPGEKWPEYGFRRDDRPGRATAVFGKGFAVEYDPKAAQRRAWEGFDMRQWGNNRDDLMESLAEFFGFDIPESDDE